MFPRVWPIARRIAHCSNCSRFNPGGASPVSHAVSSISPNLRLSDLPATYGIVGLALRERVGIRSDALPGIVRTPGRTLDHLRQGIHLRGYAQKNPKQEYKREAFELFSDMLDRIKQDVVKVVLTVQVKTQADVQAVEEAPAVSNVKYQHAGYDEALASAGSGNGDTAVAIAPPPPFVRAGQKVGRNDLCPCGSGKKYKHCHGRLG